MVLSPSSMSQQQPPYNQQDLAQGSEGEDATAALMGTPDQTCVFVASIFFNHPLLCRGGHVLWPLCLGHPCPRSVRSNGRERWNLSPLPRYPQASSSSSSNLRVVPSMIRHYSRNMMAYVGVCQASSPHCAAASVTSWAATDSSGGRTASECSPSTFSRLRLLLPAFAHGSSAWPRQRLTQYRPLIACMMPSSRWPALGFAIGVGAFAIQGIYISSA